MAIRHVWLIPVLLATATLAVFAPVGRYEFINCDDYAYVTLNPVVQQGLTWQGIKWAFGQLHTDATYWHPLTWLSHMLDCQLFGLNPAGHHLGNVVFHTLNTVLLFVLLRRLTGRLEASALVAALFALHPLQVGTVAWVAERKNVLSALFWILTLLAYVRYTTRPTGTGYTLVLVLMALGLMAKPILVTLPCVMLLLDFWPLGRPSFKFQVSSVQSGELETENLKLETSPGSSSGRKPIGWLFLEKLPLFALSAASSLVTLYGHKELGALVQSETLPLADRAANAVVAYALYLRKLVWPVDLSVFYMHPGKWPAITVAGSALLLLALSIVALLQARRRPYLLVGWLWFLGTLVPTIGLVQAHLQALADRFAYVPAIGVFLMVVWTAADWTARWFQQKRLQAAFAGLVLLACVVMTSWQLRFWKNSVVLLKRAVHLESGNAVARVMLGNAFFERGELDAALREYSEARRLRPQYPDAWQRAGSVLHQQGRTAEAIDSFLAAIRLAPQWPAPQHSLALALIQQGRTEEARTVYHSLATLLPRTDRGQTQLAEMLAEGQQFADALHHYRAALRLNPDFVPALNNLGWLRATCALAHLRDGAEAVQLAERACQLSGRRTPAFLGTLAAAYAEAGRFSEAIQAIQEAMTLTQTSGATQLLAVQKQMLLQFQAGKPFHEEMR